MNFTSLFMDSMIVDVVGITVLILGLFYDRPMPSFSHMIVVAILSGLARGLARTVLRDDTWRALVAASYFR